VLNDQYCVRLPTGRDVSRRKSSYALWRLSKPELKAVIRNWDKVRWIRKIESPREPRPGRFHPTAIARKKAPVPLREGVKHFAACENALYHGVGRDQPGLELLKRRCECAVAYDPYHPDQAVTHKPAGQFDEVVSMYTLNVVGRPEGKEILREIHSKLKPGGHATIAVRRDIC
jgi:hypothetical protein